MGVQKYCITQNQLIAAIKTIIDDYVAGKTTNITMKNNITELLEINKNEFYYTDGTIKKKIKKEIGKKRIEMIQKVLNEKGEK